MKYQYNTLVIGAGSGGLTVAFWLAAAGKKVALIEGRSIGGDCTNYGCIPSKALIDIAKSWKNISLQEALKEVRVRRQEIQNEETKEKIEAKGIKVYQGYARFIDEHSVQVGDTTILSAQYIVIATGSRAQKIDIPGVDPEDVLTNEEIFELEENIQKLIVIGGGYIGCELAESIAAFWVQVSLLQRNSVLIPREEKKSQELLKNIFLEKWISVYTGTTLWSAQEKKLSCTKDTEGVCSIDYDKILIALGRIPNIEKLELQNAGIQSQASGVIVDSYNRTNKKHIFAIGDCVSDNPQFTHWANNEGRGVVRNILVPIFKKSVRSAILPAVLYTHLEVARVGKTREELLSFYTPDEVMTHTLCFDLNDRSKVTQDTQGFIQVHFTILTGKILWATIFWKHAGEMLWVFTLAMQQGISAYKLSRVIQAYPTKSDLIKRINDLYVIDTITHLRTYFASYLHSRLLQLITFVLWGSFLGGFWYFKNTYDLSIEDITNSLYQFFKNHPFAPLLYMCLYAIRPLILFPATLMTFMSGVLFGFFPWFFYTLIGETASAIIAYFFGNIFGKKLLRWEQTGGIITTLQKKLVQNPFISVLSTRLLFFPFDLTNYACGFLKVPLKYFIFATFLGIMPGMSVFILAGAAFQGVEQLSFSQAIASVDTSFLLAAAALFIMTLISAKLFKKFSS